MAFWIATERENRIPTHPIPLLLAALSCHPNAPDEAKGSLVAFPGFSQDSSAAGGDFSAGFCASFSGSAFRTAPSQFAELWREMQDIQYEVAKDSIKKRVTEEKSPPQVVTYTHAVNARESKKMRHDESGKRQHVGNPVTKRAVRLQPVSDIKSLGSSTSKYDTQNDSCGNAQNKVPVVSQSGRGTYRGTWTKNLCPSHFAHATQLSSAARDSKIAATTRRVGYAVGVLFLARCIQE